MFAFGRERVPLWIACLGVIPRPGIQGRHPHVADRAEVVVAVMAAVAEDAMVKLDELDRARLERLFEKARGDRNAAFQLKEELDRLDVFDEYEDRFLDLFKRVT